MLFKFIVVLAMVAILSAMFVAGRNILSGERTGGNALLSFKWRIGLSVSLFILLFIAFAFGYIQPHGIR